MLRRRTIGFHGWRPDKPDHRDKRYQRAAIPSGLPSAGVLAGAESFLPPIRDQGEQGSCVGHAIAQAVAFKRNALGQEPLDMSPRFAYYNARLIEGTTATDAGAEIRDGVRGVAKLGLATEALAPYDPAVWAARPSALAYRGAQRDLLKSYQRVDSTQPDMVKAALLDGDPVVFGMSWFDNADSQEVADSGMIPMPEGDMTGGHAMWLVGFDDAVNKGSFWVANSWGNEWGAPGPNGERGYAWLPYDYLSNTDLADDFWRLDFVS